jgi:hypothetical protein
MIDTKFFNCLNELIKMDEENDEFVQSYLLIMK